MTVRSAEIEAPLTFLRPMEGRPTIYQYEPPAGVPPRTGEYDDHVITIRDARPIADTLSIDEQGFQLIDAPSALADFTDDAAIRSIYYPEVERLLREATGAEMVVNFDHTIRNAARAERKEAGIRPPVGRAHNDFTLKSGPERARTELEARGLDPGLVDGRRLAMVNLWRPIGHAVERWPLALCDARSIAPGELVETDLVYEDRVGEIHALNFGAGQHWYTFPRVTPDEAILIKVYDSDPSVARFTAHGAFDDPGTRADAPERESIEARSLLLFAR